MDFLVAQLDDAVSRLLSSKEKETSFLCDGHDSMSVGGYRVHLLSPGIVEVSRKRDECYLYLESDASSKFGWKECTSINSRGVWRVGMAAPSNDAKISYEMWLIDG